MKNQGVTQNILQQHQSIQAKRLNTSLQFNAGQFHESHSSLNIYNMLYSFKQRRGIHVVCYVWAVWRRGRTRTGKIDRILPAKLNVVHGTWYTTRYTVHCTLNTVYTVYTVYSVHTQHLNTFPARLFDPSGLLLLKGFDPCLVIPDCRHLQTSWCQPGLLLRAKLH